MSLRSGLICLAGLLLLPSCEAQTPAAASQPYGLSSQAPRPGRPVGDERQLLAVLLISEAPGDWLALLMVTQ